MPQLRQQDGLQLTVSRDAQWSAPPAHLAPGQWPEATATKRPLTTHRIRDLGSRKQGRHEAHSPAADNQSCILFVARLTFWHQRTSTNFNSVSIHSAATLACRGLRY